jgi:hypothetical protein
MGERKKERVEEDGFVCSLWLCLSPETPGAIIANLAQNKHKMHLVEIYNFLINPVTTRHFYCNV